MTSYDYIIVDSFIILFNLKCIMQLKQYCNIATKVSNRKKMLLFLVIYLTDTRLRFETPLRLLWRHSNAIQVWSWENYLSNLVPVGSTISETLSSGTTGRIFSVRSSMYLSTPRGRNHDDVIKWKYFPRYWPFVRGIHRSPVIVLIIKLL